MNDKTKSKRSATVHRRFKRYSRPLTSKRRNAVGESFYVSDLIEGATFPTRGRAEDAEKSLFILTGIARLCGVSL